MAQSGDKYLKTACMLFVSTGSAADNLTLDWMDPANGEVSSSAMLRGENYQVYTEALLRRGNLDTSYTLAGGTTSVFPTLALNTTRAVVDFASMFDYAFLGNAPSRSLVQAIKNRSRRPDGTKVGLYFGSLTSIPHKGNANAWFDSLDGVIGAAGAGNLIGTALTTTYTSTAASPAVFTITGPVPVNGQPIQLGATGIPAGGAFVAGTTYFVVGASGATAQLAATVGGTAINSPGGTGTGNWLLDGRPSGCTSIDQYQTDGSGGASATCGAITSGGGVSTHTWLVNMNALVANATFPFAVKSLLLARYSGDLDYFLWDNCNPTRYTNTAGNYSGTATTTDANATTGYLPKLKEELALIDTWGNQLGIGMGRNGGGHGRPNDAYLSGGTFGTFANSPSQRHFRYQEHFKGTGGTPSGTPETFDNIMKYCDAATRSDYINFLDFTYSSQRGTSSNGTNFNSGTRSDAELWCYNTGPNSYLFDGGPGIRSSVDYGNMRRLHQYLIQTKGRDSNVIVNARSSSAFGLFWDPAFGPVV